MTTAAPHAGIRYENDLHGEWSVYVIDSVDLINAQLAPQRMGFFFDSCDFRQQIINGKYCWDMYGWVVPNERIAEFEPIWLASEDEKLDEKYDYVCANWEDRDGRPYAAIDGELPEEAYA